MIKDYMTRHNEAQKIGKIKSIIDFDENRTKSIKSVAIKKNSPAKFTTWFMKGKMLMFSKISLTSFVCDVTNVFCFPDENVKKTFGKYNIQKCFLY